MEVTAPSGLNLRKGPGLHAPIINKIPFGETVTVDREAPKTKDTIGWYLTPVLASDSAMVQVPLNGSWVEADYKGENGYLFDVYLRELYNKESMDKRYYQNGTNSKFKLVFPWYNCFDNFWRRKENNWYGVIERNGKFKFEPMELEYYSFHDPEYFTKIIASSQENYSFFISFPEKPESLDLNNWALKDSTIQAEKGLTITKGQVIISRNGIEQIIDPYKYDGITSGLESIIWYGDLDGDGFPDLIAKFGIKTNYTILFLSSETDSGQLLKPVAIYFGGYCC
ncbi:MAG: SH3 domain-containing protein [Saprospiraceae bacterium]